jgi:hypothetical protein
MVIKAIIVSSQFRSYCGFFYPFLAGMVVETQYAQLPGAHFPFNPPLAGMVVETQMVPIPGTPRYWVFQPTPSWDGR